MRKISMGGYPHRPMTYADKISALRKKEKSRPKKKKARNQ